MPKVFSEDVVKLGVWAAAGKKAKALTKANEAFKETEATLEWLIKMWFVMFFFL